MKAPEQETKEALLSSRNLGSQLTLRLMGELLELLSLQGFNSTSEIRTSAESKHDFLNFYAYIVYVE